ncbi:MAG: hypothetical protein JWN37_173 [Candidatus Nomurabacteria bacterium]|nr:hypothetical protein [Candidatus Nomurabacteria bacterium]
MINSLQGAPMAAHQDSPDGKVHVGYKEVPVFDIKNGVSTPAKKPEEKPAPAAPQDITLVTQKPPVLRL